jgi:hypothetical protein
MKIFTINKADINTFEISTFCFGVLTGNSAAWYIHHGGIITKGVTPLVKQAFKEMMPFIHKRFPEIPHPFSGKVEIDGPQGKIVEIRFTH